MNLDRCKITYGGKNTERTEYKRLPPFRPVSNDIINVGRVSIDFRIHNYVPRLTVPKPLFCCNIKGRRSYLPRIQNSGARGCK